jgi:antitoxin VapB
MEAAMTVARIFKAGGSQAVRLPKEFRFTGKEVEIFRRGEEVVLREKSKGLGRAFEILAGFPEDFLADRNDTPPQERESLDAPLPSGHKHLRVHPASPAKRRARKISSR